MENKRRAFLDYIDGGAGSGDRLARLLQPQLRRIALSLLHETPEDMEDAVQHTLLSVLEYFEGRRYDREANFEGFASVVCKNKCLDIIRKRKQGRLWDGISPEEIATGAEGPEAKLLRDELRQRLNEAYRGLDPECRRLIRELFISNRSAEEVRERMGVKTVQVVYYRKTQCLRKMKKNFKNFDLLESIDRHGVAKMLRRIRARLKTR